MILQKDIVTIAENAGVAKTVIDKDWVLGHFIAALFSIPEIAENLVFKGGTCLRKCWFPELLSRYYTSMGKRLPQLTFQKLIYSTFGLTYK